VTSYAAFVFPEPIFYQQALTSSLDDGLDRWEGYGITDLGLSPLQATVTHTGSTTRINKSAAAYVHPDWSSFLFGHILIIPARLDLGNLLTGQFVNVEVANLFLTPQEWTELTTTVAGLTFLNSPFVGSGSVIIQPFGSFLLEVSISAEGPSTVFGGIEFGFDGPPDITVPVTGVRSILFAFEPLTPIVESLEWATDILQSHDGTEQRISIRDAPRQRFTLELIRSEAIDRKIQSMFFDWLPRPFVVPIWWEYRPLTAPALTGETEIFLDTDNGDFRVGGSVMVYQSEDVYESLTIDAINSGSLELVTAVAGVYPTGTKVMPMRSAYAKTVPQSARIPNTYTRHAVEFMVIENEPLDSVAGSTLYGTKVLLDDCNLSESGENDAWSRAVVVLDNSSGVVLQSSHIDRSQYRTRKLWDITSQAELWRVRKLLHAFGGSRVSFFLPSFRADFELLDIIGPGSSTFRVTERGYTAFIQSRRGMGDVRLVLKTGVAIVRRILGSVVDGGTVEVITVDSAFSVLPIDPVDVERLEIVYLVRIADDAAEIIHGRRGDARISINVCSVKE
jgi:hypothetical protein